MIENAKITRIKEMLAEKRPVKDICAVSNLSKTQFYRIIRDYGLCLHYHRKIDDPHKIKQLINSGKTQFQTAEILGIGRGTVKYWLKKLGETTLHKKRCALFECGKEFFAINPCALCCCYDHTNRHLKRKGRLVGYKTCGLPECNNHFVSVGDDRKWCCSNHHELHRRRVHKWGFYARIMGFDDARCLACGESVILDAHHCVFKRKSREGPKVWLCPTHHMAIHRGLAKIENGKYASLIEEIRQQLPFKHPKLMEELKMGLHKRTAPSGKSFMTA